MDKLYEIRKRVADYIKRNNMIANEDVVVTGVSGGADSMCLLSLLLELRDIWNIEIVVVHVHHGIRGQAADEDMEYVKQFCRLNSVEFEGFHFDIPAIALENHISEEEAGRLKRYEAFNIVWERKTAEGKKCKIAVAHNADDNSETFLFNLFRGTGIKGLTGISPVRDRIIRPVMCLERKDILDYLLERKTEYRLDETNLETDYTRNKVRLKLLPYIEENINFKARTNINRVAAMLTEINEYMEKQAFAAYNKNTYSDKGSECINILQDLWNEDNIIVRMVIRIAVEGVAGRLKDITSKHIDSIAELGNNQVSRSVDLPYGLRAVKTYKGITIKKVNKVKMSENKRTEEKKAGKPEDKNQEFRLDNLPDGRYVAELDQGYMTFCIEKNTSLDLSEKGYTKFMNCDILTNKLSLRNRRTGDYMVIDSAGSKKKLKDMLIDLKIPREEREELLLLARGQEILWIVGYRMSERCKVDKSDTEIYRVTFTKKPKRMEKNE